MHETQFGINYYGVKPRVLCFGRFYDEIPGGMQRHIEHLFSSLKNNVDYVHLVPSRNWSSAKFSLHGFPVYRNRSINFDGSFALSPGLPLAAIQLHKKYDFDIVHLHFPDPMSHLASLVLPQSIRRIISWHADITRQKRLLSIYRPLIKRALSTAQAIIVATPGHIASSPDLAPHSGSDKIHVIPYGFSLDRFSTTGHLVDRIRTEYPYRLIFALGRHVYYKGFDVLIKAMTLIDPSVHLLLGGIGPLTDQLKTTAKSHSVSDRVHFLGHIDESELPSYYQACDVFCLPSTSPAEAFGIVQVEAMASGKPIVSTDLGNGVNFVNIDGLTGLLTEPGNSKSLAAALQKVLSDEQYRLTMGQNARERAFAEFTMEKMADRTLSVYRGVLNMPAVDSNT